MDNLIEYLIVAVILLWSCYVVVRRFMPKTSFKVLQALAVWLEQKGQVRLGQWVKPSIVQGSCSSGCSDCSVVTSDTACSTGAAKTAATQNDTAKEQPVQWR
ncbi:DUF6587 family protein [Alkanindiges sp. WGS2144]|uniref:DUF6587 family protein n=1 Tax=Alkanindiges sp. WGS2144 TaxID=3366808 RepID=UPI003751FB82